MAFFSEEGPGVDFDDLYTAWVNVAASQARLDSILATLDGTRASCKKQAYAAEKPSMEYLKQVVHYLGNTPEQEEILRNLQEEAISAQEELTRAKGRLDALQTKVRVWQTMSANARKALVVE